MIIGFMGTCYWIFEICRYCGKRIYLNEGCLHDRCIRKLNMED